MQKILKRTAGATAAIALAVTIGTSVASAEPSAELVTFGDSFTANPDTVLNALNNSGLPIPELEGTVPVETTDGCAQAMNNWPRQLGEQQGLSVADYSCTAGTSTGAVQKLQTAIADGKVGPGTKHIVAMIGGNDFGGFGALDTMTPPTKENVNAQFMDNMDAFVAEARRVAPDVQITLAGYPEVLDQNRLCLIQLDGNAPVGFEVPGNLGVQYQDWMAEQMGWAADKHDLVFVDNYNMTRGHSTCAPAEQRYVTGIIDNETDWNMQLHPTAEGSRVVAENVGATF
ncbi:GDSL-type esterase/lipase family protein [Corynebacterium sputi]|uniref:GDSL-type esterase/lipase family protein n=1 Tax=Corynebacterium sputi TaxID=489915 RepID=UPI0012EB26C1|nr:GDSL-type esterase/lipase family protein [Corynebacterium sputi]